MFQGNASFGPTKLPLQTRMEDQTTFPLTHHSLTLLGIREVGYTSLSTAMVFSGLQHLCLAIALPPLPAHGTEYQPR